MSENASCVDMVSELPDFILHQILSFLPAKEAAKTCVISKRWNHIWETFPILDFCHFLFGKYLDIVNPKELGLPKYVRRKIFDQRVMFMSYIDKKLWRIAENDRCLKKFRIVITLVSVGLYSRVDSWMDLVSGLSVQELELRLTLRRERFYQFPMKVLTSQSLTILCLNGCMLIDCLSKNDLKLSSLAELHLQGCFIDEGTIMNLVSAIQSIEVLSFKACLGFTKLELHGHKKLKMVIYHPHTDLNIMKFNINLPNLEEIDFGFSDGRSQGPLFISDLVCPKLIRLSLCEISMNAKILRDIVSSFPLLEQLFLRGCVMKGNVKLSSSVLREVYLRNCAYVERAEFDTPKLRVFKYCTVNMSHLSLNSVTGNRIAEIFVPTIKDMDMSWFKKLNNFIRENRFRELILLLSVGRSYDFLLNPENYSREQLPQPFELKSMKLVMHTVPFSSVNYAALLDGLFWNLHPKTLRLELNHNSPTCVKGLLRSLVAGEEQKCCQAVHEENTYCWRHLLKGIKFVNVKGFQPGTSLDLFTLSSLNDYLDNWAIETQRLLDSYETVGGETLSFDLSW